MAIITVIIPMYNKGELVLRAIHSIQQQTFSDIKIIIIDDGSIDNSAEIVRNVDDDRIQLIQQKNAGPGAARNTGIKATKTQYVAFLDADDEWYPWFLENSLKAIHEYDVEVVASMYYRLPDGTGMTDMAAKNGVYPGKYSLDGTEDPVWTNALISMLNSINILVKTETIRKYKGFYDKEKCVHGEDQMLFMQMAINEKFAIITPAAVRYHMEDSQLGTVDMKRPLQPYLANPEEVLACCPAEKKELMASVLELRAIRTACHMLGRGQRKEAAKLIKNFPGAVKHKKLYHKLMRKFGLGPVYPMYLSFKKIFIKPVKTMLESSREKDHKPLPLMPYEQGYNDKQ